MLSRSETCLVHSYSFYNFVNHCTLSYPTAELLDTLWNLDTFSFWKRLFKEATFEWSGFVTWLKNNVSHSLVTYSSGNTDLVYYLGVYQGRTRLIFPLYARLGPVDSAFSNTRMLDSLLIILAILQPFDRYLTETLNDPQRLLLSRLAKFHNAYSSYNPLLEIT